MISSVNSNLFCAEKESSAQDTWSTGSQTRPSRPTIVAALRQANAHLSQMLLCKEIRSFEPFVLLSLPYTSSEQLCTFRFERHVLLLLS